MISHEDLELVREVVEDFLAYLPFQIRSQTDQKNDKIQINLYGPDRSYLLADEGETLLSLQFIVAKMIRARVSGAESMRIVLDSDGFLSHREDDLRHLARRSMKRVAMQRRGVKLPPMNPYQRRIVHTEVMRSREFDSFSEGEGFIKQVVIRRRY